VQDEVNHGVVLLSKCVSVCHDADLCQNSLTCHQNSFIIWYPQQSSVLQLIGFTKFWQDHS